MKLTMHSIEREKDRRNIRNIDAVEKDVANARKRGRQAESFTSWERSYLNKEARGGCTAVAYNDFCYIFNANNQCVTLYRLPVWFGKKKHFNGKERIRKYKKYCQINMSFSSLQE